MGHHKRIDAQGGGIQGFDEVNLETFNHSEMLGMKRRGGGKHNPLQIVPL